MSDIELRVLSRFLNYVLRPTKATRFVLLFCEILTYELWDNVLDRLKIELKREVFLSQSRSLMDEISITNDEHDGITSC